MTRTGFWLRLGISAAIDALDFTFGRLPMFGMAGDGAGALVSFLLWGPVGLVYLAELIDVTEQLDGFIPTATLIGLYVGWRKGFLFKPKDAPAAPPAER